MEKRKGYGIPRNPFSCTEAVLFRGSLARQQEEEDREDKVDRQKLDALVPVGLSAAADKNGYQDGYEDKGNLPAAEGKDEGLGRRNKAQQYKERRRKKGDLDAASEGNPQRQVYPVFAAHHDG